MFGLAGCLLDCVIQLLIVIGTEVGKKPDALVTLVSGCWQATPATSKHDTELSSHANHTRLLALHRVSHAATSIMHAITITACHALN